MAFTSVEFILFVLCVGIVFFAVPGKVRYIWLLVASVGFYALWSVPNAILLLGSALGTYLLGRLAEPRAEDDGRAARRRKGVVVLGILLLVAELFVFKYLNFTLKQANALLKGAGRAFRFDTLKIVVPVGVSFYVFQSIGYLADVYRGKVRAERNVGRFLLFITFFPKIIQGPIERSDGFLKQIGELDARGRFDYRRVSGGLVTALWGFFMKMVIADRLAIVVDRVFDTYFIYGTVELAFAAVCYAIQIYCDFAGYSAIALGVARIFGFELTQNFDCPYFSVSTREFWRRWHVSLSAWFRDYVYIPLGGSRCSRWRKRLNVLIVMLVSGVWHGAGWNFVAWGLLHGLYQVAGDMLAPPIARLRRRYHARTESMSHKLGGMLVTFALVTLAWILFRADDLPVAIDYIRRMLTRFNPWALFDGSLLKLGLDQIEMNVLGLAMPMLVVVDLVQYRRKVGIDRMLENQRLWFRWGVIILLFTLVWVLGEYGPAFDGGSFIYQSF